MSDISDINIFVKKSNLYKSKLNEYNTNIKIVFDKLRGSYPNYKLYPNVSEIKNIYTNDKYNFIDNRNKLFSIETSLNNDNKKLLEIINNKNNQLNELKKNNESLKKKYESMIDTDASSFGLHSQTQDKYQQNYISLVLLVTFTFIFLSLGYKHINPQSNTIQYKPISKEINKL